MQPFTVILVLTSLAAMAAANQGGYLYKSFPVIGHYADHYAYPRYSYNYGVHSPHTGDVKNQWESRDGDLVKGSYRLNEPDGTIRQVDYTADKHNGFNAVVKRIGKAAHPSLPARHNHGTFYGGYRHGGPSYVNGFSHAIGHYGAYPY